MYFANDINVFRIYSTPSAKNSQESDREKFTRRIILQIITNLVQLPTKVGI